MKKRTARFLWALAAVLLAAELVFVNLPGDRPVSVGAEEGQYLTDFSIDCLDGSRFVLSEQRGKVVVINLWATWCTPCVRELPNFDRLQEEHPSDVAVLALHASPVTADVEDYLSSYSYAIPFAVDYDGSVGELLNASAVLPQTVIVDPGGAVTYNRPGDLSYEELAELAASAGR